MKRSLAIVSILAIGSTSAIAGKIGDKIIGIEYGKMHTNSTVTANGSTSSFSGSDNTTYEALKVGKYFNFGRITMTLGHGNEKEGLVSNYIAFSYDYVYYNSSKFSPFIGTTLEYDKATFSLDDESAKFSNDVTGINYGGEIGLTYDVLKNLECEVGYKYLYSNMSGTSPVYVKAYNKSVDVNIDINNISQYYFELNYKF